jgi:hypothetical protein
MSKYSNNVNLKEISQRVYRSEYLDGLTFIFLGFFLIATAFVINLHSVFMSLLVAIFIASFPLSKVLRTRYTYPRLGYFKVKTDDPKKLVPGMLELFMILRTGIGFYPFSLDLLCLVPVWI